MTVKQTKKAIPVAGTTVTTISSGQKFMVTDASGHITYISLADLKDNLFGGIPIYAIEDGVMIMYHRKSDNYPLASKLSAWAALQNAGEVADGVLVTEGSKHIVVAPTEATLYWSSAGVTGGGVQTTDRLTALNDWAGKNNTTAQAAKSECSGASYAPGFCHTYARSNGNEGGLGAGKWWLPSIGELMMMYNNKLKINYALSLINGATQLAEAAHWSSTEYSQTGAWSLYFSNGTVDGNAKATYQIHVRPVSAFIA